MSKRRQWIRLSGPMLSVILHVVVILVLAHTIGYTMLQQDEAMTMEIVEAPDIDLEELVPLDPLDVPLDPTDNVEPLAPEDVQEIVDVDDVAPPSLDDMLPSLDSPLRIDAASLGVDAGTRSALTRRYGNRARENGLLGSYFNQIDFNGETYMRIDKTMNHQWEENSPWPEYIDPETFSVLWTGRLVPSRSGRYTLYLLADDGARLWINGDLVLDQWKEVERTSYEVQLDMLAGLSYDIKFAFCDVYVHAVSKLEWSCDDCGIPRQLIPTENMWADGQYSRQLLVWNEERGGSYPNRRQMRNPAQIEGKPFSHLVNYENLDPEGLARLGLEDLAREFARFKERGNAPREAFLPEMPAGQELETADERNRKAAEPDDDEITITIF
jgi:hypothetical protein